MPIVTTRSNTGASSLGWSTSAGFWPGSLSPKLWLDAADASTITEAGGSVSQWDNKGSLDNFVQGSGALQPTTGVTTLNGLNVIDFASDYLTSADSASAYKFMHDGAEYLIAAVWKPGVVVDPNIVYSFVGTDGRTSANIGTTVYYDDRYSQARNDRLMHSVYAGGGVTNVENLSANGYFTPNTFTIITIIADPNNGTAANRSELFANAGTAVKNNTYTGAVSASNPTYALQIGANGNNGETLTGSIAEMIVCEGANATETNRQKLRNYLNNKWAVY